MEDKTMESVRIRKDDKAVSPVIAVILMVAITVVLAGVLYVWVTSLSTTEDEVELIVATLEQGDGNMTTGVLFVLTKGSGESVEIKDYRIRIGEEGKSPITLKWPDDGSSEYNLDSGLKTNDGDWWDATERMGFEAPSTLTGIGDGDKIEVSIINLGTGDVVFTSTFTYRE
jgi:flagellin-like protein